MAIAVRLFVLRQLTREWVEGTSVSNQNPDQTNPNQLKSNQNPDQINPNQLNSNQNPNQTNPNKLKSNQNPNQTNHNQNTNSNWIKTQTLKRQWWGYRQYMQGFGCPKDRPPEKNFKNLQLFFAFYKKFQQLRCSDLNIFSPPFPHPRRHRAERCPLFRCWSKL